MGEIYMYDALFQTMIYCGGFMKTAAVMELLPIVTNTAGLAKQWAQLGPLGQLSIQPRFFVYLRIPIDTFLSFTFVNQP